ncbi:MULTISPECIES: YHYH protein [Microbacterium]|uniref:YHYH protein n=1 Tax=Microbacterium marmarense TaxID=3122051 RepID=A0ABU8LRA3_9MICO
MMLSRSRRVSRTLLVAGLAATVALLAASCAASEEEASSSSSATSEASDTATETVVAPTGIDLTLFADDAIVGEPELVDCTLSEGTETTCYEFTISGYPSTYETGPFCPDTITTSADDAGIWFDGEDVYDLDGEFIAGLADLYGSGWQMYDEDGNVYVTETIEAFEAAARPDVDPEYQNYCIEGSIDFLDNSEPIETTVTIPAEPVAASAASSTQGNLGVTLDGVVIALSAPVDAILGAYTIAAFDDCGGHYNPFEGYHLHGAAGCSEVESASEDETGQFGYAMDGYPVFSPYTEEQLESVELDECNGHTTEAEGYHYHANAIEENLVIECFVGQVVANEEGAGGPPAGGPND